MTTLISIFKHPALNIGDLVKCCMDVVERQDGVTPDKQPWNILLARLEVILHVLEEYGIDESLWDWYPLFTELIIPSLFHQNPDCRLIAIEICVLLYRIVGDDIKIIINDLNNLKPNLKETINNKFNEIDLTFKKDIQMQHEGLKRKEEQSTPTNESITKTNGSVNLITPTKEKEKPGNKLFQGSKPTSRKSRENLEPIIESNEN